MNGDEWRIVTADEASEVGQLSWEVQVDPGMPPEWVRDAVSRALEMLLDGRLRSLTVVAAGKAQP